ncbi:MAG TPA: hypothetical protein VLA61_16260 [Ideonella sp.]|nr:hypothetical protein [Ideonella sp.]HSI49826.1 hypothetical protein [Ideonella sp.]
MTLLAIMSGLVAVFAAIALWILAIASQREHARLLVGTGSASRW